jgi:hypothetical protein
MLTFKCYKSILDSHIPKKAKIILLISLTLSEINYITTYLINHPIY